MEENQNLWIWMSASQLGSATSWLRQWTNNFIEYQKNARQANMDEFNAKNDNQIRAIIDEGLKATDHWVAQECNRTTRMQSVAKWIRDFYWNSRWKDYSSIEDVPLIDAYIKANPSSKKPIYSFILDEWEICDPTPLYEQMWRQKKEIVPESEVASTEDLYDTNRGRYSVLTPNEDTFSRYDPTSWEEAWEWWENKLEWFADNFWGSLSNFIKDISDLILNLGDTAKTLVQLPVGATMNALGSDDYIDRMTNEAVKKWYNEANNIADWAWDYLVERWWWKDENWNWNGLMDWLATMANTLYEDPVWWFDDIMWIVEWWAWLTDNILRKSYKYTNNASLLKAADRAKQISDTAEAISPSWMVTHPIRTVKGWAKLAWKARNSVADTRPGRAISEFIENSSKKISDYVAQSERMKKLKSFANTKRGKIIFPEAHDIYMDLTPTSAEFKTKFARQYGEDYADYLNKKWIVWGPEEVVDRLQFENDKLYKDVTNAVKEMEIPIDVAWNKYVEEMLKYNISHAYYTMDRTKSLPKMLEAYNKYLTTGQIDPMDLLFNKRYFERKTKFAYWAKWVAPEKWEKATNIDNEIREILLQAADEQWATNLRELSKNIGQNKSIMDAIGEDAMKKHHGWNLGFSDYVLMVAGADSGRLKTAMLKKVLNSDWFKKLQLKMGNKLRDIVPEWFGSVDIDEIRKSNAEYRVSRAYEDAMWDWTPRLTDDVQWWVVATDNDGWANMRPADAIAYADRVIELYRNSPRNVEKKIVERIPTDTSETLKKAQRSNSSSSKSTKSTKNTKSTKKTNSSNEELVEKVNNVKKATEETTQKLKETNPKEWWEESLFN